MQGDGPARYTLPSLLQGHPPSQSSGTLMSLQEGIAGPRVHAATANPCSMSPQVGALTSHTESPQCPQPNVHSWRAVCGTQPQYSPSPFPHTLPTASSPRFASLPRSHAPYLVPQGGGREAGERPVCSVATSGCPTRSEDGFPAGARNIPPRPVEVIRKAPRRGPGLVERLTGIEPAYQAWEACALPLSYSRIFFSVSRLLAGGEMCCGVCCRRYRG